MKALKSIIVAILLAGLLLSALAACGGSTESPVASATEPSQASQSEPTQAVEAQPTQAPAPTQAPENTTAPADTAPTEAAASEGLDPSSLTSESSLTSYRSTTSIVTTGTKDGQQVEESMQFTVEYTQDPLMEHVIMTGTNVDSTVPEGIEMYNTADTTYMKMGDQWLSMPATEDSQIGQSLITPDDMLETTCGWKKKGDSNVDGVAVEHYTATKDDMVNCTGLGLLVDSTGLTDAGGDLYVAKDGNYIVQMDFFYEGTDLNLNLGTADESAQQGRVEIHTTMSDVNQPFTIQIPEEAINAGALPEDIPVPEDAEEVNNMFGMITFNSPGTTQEVADYYKAEMPNNGWTQTSDEDLGGMLMLEYTKDARTASFMINTDSDTGKTSVMITVQDGQ